MIFEFNEAKSEANKAKHKIDFNEAQKLWQDVDALRLPARSDVESRQRLLAQLDGKLWSAIFTKRGGALRIISVRRARSEEEALYEQDQNDSGES
ncbi:MAG: BrnT family toxin [Verrucomicrobia bacterium]|nr:BrnT family toxin [Verrucomicrobiota bacterium]